MKSLMRLEKGRYRTETGERNFEALSKSEMGCAIQGFMKRKKNEEKYEIKKKRRNGDNKLYIKYKVRV